MTILKYESVTILKPAHQPISQQVCRLGRLPQVGLASAPRWGAGTALPHRGMDLLLPLAPIGLLARPPVLAPWASRGRPPRVTGTEWVRRSPAARLPARRWSAPGRSRVAPRAHHVPRTHLHQALHPPEAQASRLVRWLVHVQPRRPLRPQVHLQCSAPPNWATAMPTVQQRPSP